MPSADLLTRWPALQVAGRHARLHDTSRVVLGPIADAVAAQAAAAARAGAGLWRRDTSVWSRDRDVQQTIANRLGWLDSPALMAESLDRLRRFADGVKQQFTDVVLLGMGGSSLAPEVLRSILGTTAGYPRFQMLDSTDPASIIAAATPVDRTLYILASKSGGTIEPNSLAAHFRKRLEDAGVAHWADHFIAITDAGTELAERAKSERFREVFINPSDIGGRYSALSFFGLVPAAIMGQDIEALVGWGLAMLASVDPDGSAMGAHAPGSTGPADPIGPAVQLGLTIGAAALQGRDKLTLVVPRALEAFGLWVEQLVAESTGKNGVGVLPVAGEQRGPTKVYGADRLFVVLHLDGEPREAELRDIVGTHAPVVTIEVLERQALGAEFVRWEIATAVASALLGINPFDEPNVKQAKDATRTLLDDYKTKGQLPVPTPDLVRPDGVALTLSRAARETTDRNPERLLSQVRPGDYLAVLAYLGPAPELMNALNAFRRAARDRTHAATTLGYGPRYLHSTGQLHKGGPNTGVFLLITAEAASDLPIPGEAFSFGILERAQALGDFASLDAAGRRALHIHLPVSDPHLLRNALQGLLSA